MHFLNFKKNLKKKYNPLNLGSEILVDHLIDKPF
jgi:hypothetical protein